MINLKKSPEIFSQNQEKIENKEVQSNFEELKKSKEKGFFDKAGEKISHYYDVAEKSIKKDVKEKKWGKLLLKGGATLLGLWGVKKATELVSSATKNIFSIFGFGKEKLDESVSNTTWEMLKGPLKFIVGGAVVNQLFKFINGESPLDQLGDFVQKNLGDVPDALKKMLYKLPVVGGSIKSSFEKSDDNGVEIKRTDRHNNPAAIIYEGFSKNLKVLGYVEGEDFEKGDEFTDEEGKKYHTIKFKDKKTGIEATIKLIDKVGFFNESLGKNRWDYTEKLGMNNEKWKKLSYMEKFEFLKKMYKHEGGDGKFFDGVEVKDDKVEFEKGVSEKVKEILKQNPNLEKVLFGVINFTRETLGNLNDDFKKDYPDFAEYIPDLEGISNSSPVQFLSKMLKMGIGEEKFENLKDVSNITINMILTLYLGKKFVQSGMIGRGAISAFVIYGLKKKFIFANEIIDSLGETIINPKKAVENAIEGKFNIIFGEGSIILATTGLNPVSIVCKLGIGVFNTMMEYIEEKDYFGAVGMGVGTLVIGRSFGHGVKGLKELVFDEEISKLTGKGNTSTNKMNPFGKLIKSMYFKTSEGKYLINTMKEGLPLYKFFYENKIYAQFGYANDLIGEIKKTKDIEKIKHLTEELQNLEIFKNELNGYPRTKTEFDFFESIKDLKAKIKSFEKGLRVGGKIDEKMLKNIEDGISEKMKFSSKIYEKFKKFIDFRWGMGEKIFGQKKENLSPQEKIKLQKISQIDKKLLGLEAEKFLKLEAKNFTPEKISEILKGKSEKFFEAEKKAEKEIVGKIDEIKKFAKENNLHIKSPEIQNKIQKLNDELSKIVENKTKVFNKINELFSGLPEKYQTPELISSIKKFKNGTFLVKIKDGIIQRGKLAVIMGAVMVGTDTFLNREKIAENPEQELAKILQDLGPDMVQLLIDILPFVGTGSNFYAGFTGEESYTGKDVSGGWERTSNFLFGTAGLVMDTLTITGIGATVGIPGRITLAVSKLGLKGKKAEKMTKDLKLAVEKISAIAEKTSWMEVAKNFKKILSTKKFQAEKVANYATYGGMATMIGGGAMNYYYSPDGNIEVNKKLEN